MTGHMTPHPDHMTPYHWSHITPPPDLISDDPLPLVSHHHPPQTSWPG